MNLDNSQFSNELTFKQYWESLQFSIGFEEENIDRNTKDDSDNIEENMEDKYRD